MKSGEGSWDFFGIRRGAIPGVLTAVLLAVPLILGGCAEDLLGALGNTTILGRVVDPVGNPIFGIPVGVVYETVSASAPAPPRPLTPAAADLQNPYPNPSFGSLTIPVTVDVPTPVQVEIRGAFAGGTGPVDLIYNGTVTKDSIFTWDGRDNFNDDVPNGLYFVRLTSPPGSSENATDFPVILNRSASLLASLEIFNAVSGPDGKFAIDDIAVEESFTATSQTGQNLGPMMTRARVVLVFRDPDFQPRDVEVSISSGETVDIETQLTPLVPAVVLFE